MRHFLQKAVNEGKGVHLIKWKVVLNPVDFGGLGIGNLRARNKALLAT